MPKDNEVDEKVIWPERMVNMPCPDGTTDRIVGFRIPEGHPALGKYGLSEGTQWLQRVTLGSAATVAELRAEVERLVKALDEAACELSAAGQALAEFEGFEFRQKAAIDRAYAASQKAHDANGYTEALTKVTP